MFYSECNTESYVDLRLKATYEEELNRILILFNFFQVGDPQEVNSICDVFCKGRSSPLLIGSVKSNMGHSEPASGLCSIVKILIGMENGLMPPNLHYKTPNKDIPGLSDGRLQVHSSSEWIRFPN